MPRSCSPISWSSRTRWAGACALLRAKGRSSIRCNWRRACRGLARDLDHDILAPVYETVRLVRQQLAPNVTLLGFCGAPWTVATYMIAGEGTADQMPARLVRPINSRRCFRALIDILVEASIGYLVRQLQAGVDAVQIFDTWAGVLPPERIRALVHRADPEDHCRRARQSAGREDHRVSARRRCDAGELCRQSCRSMALDSTG